MNDKKVDQSLKGLLVIVVLIAIVTVVGVIFS